MGGGKTWAIVWVMAYPLVYPMVNRWSDVLKSINKASIRVEGVSFLTQCPAK